ncbi:MAG TPA: GAF domain-containing protein [Terriglobales bacterium]|nr:GAF domain-containing protein [Terriglobales bacterium]
MQDFPKTAQDVPGDTPQSPPPEETAPLTGEAAPAAWERFKSELGEAVPPRNGQEVLAMNAIFNELTRPAIHADMVFDMVVESAATLTGASGSALALAKEGSLVCRSAYGSTAPPVGTRLEPGSGLSGLCVRTGHMLRCDDAESDPRVDSSLTRDTGIRSISVVPLIKDGKLVGILELLSTRAHAFGKSETETLQRMAKLAVLTMTRVGELRGKSLERKAERRWLWVLSLMALAFAIGFAASRLLGPLLFH